MEPKSLLEAVETDDLIAVTEAFDRGDDANAPDASGRPMIFALMERIAAGGEDDSTTGLQRVIFLGFCTKRADLNLRDADGISPLNKALQLQEYFLASVLIASGAEVDEVFPNGSTALHEAVRLMLSDEGDRLLTNVLWKQPDPTIRDANGQSALDLAAASSSDAAPGVRSLLAALPKAQALAVEARQEQLQQLQQKAKGQKFKLQP